MSALTKQRKDTDTPPHLESKANNIRARRRGLSKQDIELLTEGRYLERVIIIHNGEEKELNTVPEIRDQILNPNIMNLTDADADINRVIDLVTKPKEEAMARKEEKTGREVEPQWIYCKHDCVRDLVKQIENEVNSTAFMLRVLTNSVIDTTDGELPLKFYYINPNNEPLTGVWGDKKNKKEKRKIPGDHRFFRLVQLDGQSIRGRLIMGLGPSASGKTFWAENVIKLLRKTDSYFPRSFLSVDGGLVRELSYVYQDIISALKKHPKIDGLNNLVSSGFDPFHTSLFSAGDVKREIKKYLDLQSDMYTNSINAQRALHKHPPIKKTSPVSVYVPETLGSPDVPILKDGFKKGVGKYVKITGDENWLGLYIWQGRTPNEDKAWVTKFKKQNPQFANENIDALSTTLSGKSRELTEGKKYSSNAYNNSKDHGYSAIGKAPGGRIDIHNSGGKYVPHSGVISDITLDEDSNKLYSILFEGENEPRTKRKKNDIYTDLTSKQRDNFIDSLQVGSKVMARKEFNKSVVIEFPNANGNYILNQDFLNSFHALYLRKQGKPVAIKGGGKKTRRRLRQNSKKRRTRKKRGKRKI